MVFELELQVRRRLLAKEGSLCIVLFISSKILRGFLRPGDVLARSEFTLTLRLARLEACRGRRLRVGYYPSLFAAVWWDLNTWETGD